MQVAGSLYVEACVILKGIFSIGGFCDERHRIHATSLISILPRESSAIFSSSNGLGFFVLWFVLNETNE